VKKTYDMKEIKKAQVLPVENQGTESQSTLSNGHHQTSICLVEPRPQLKEAKKKKRFFLGKTRNET